MLINRLPAIANQKQMSIRALSRATGITYTTIRAAYHGERRSIQLEVLEAICRALNVQPGEIYQLGPDSQAAESLGIEGELEERLERGARSLAPRQTLGQSTGSIQLASVRQSQTNDWNVWETD